MLQSSPHDDDAALVTLGLLDRSRHEGLERLAAIAKAFCRAPLALVTFVLPHRDIQFFKCALGIPEPLVSERQTPLSHSVCQIVRQTDDLLVVENAREDPRVRDNLGVRDFGVGAYLGAPVHGPGGRAVGAICVADTQPRHWRDEERTLLKELAGAADEQIRLLVALRERDQALEAARRATEAKLAFFAKMSHEIRTPLFGMLGVAGLLEETCTNDEQRTHCATIREAGSGLLTVLNDILDLTKIESGQLRLESIDFDAAAVARKVEALFAPIASQKGLALEIELDEEMVAARRGDPLRVQQIIQNLLSNALKFTTRGSVTLRLCGGPSEPLGIEVMDTGIGMTADQAARVFTAFEQGDESTARFYGGTGLGMSIIRALVEQMEGTVSLTSALGKGTSIRVSLPLAPAEAQPSEPAPASLSGALGGFRILVADDNPTNRLILQRQLERLGARATVVSGGREACEVWQPDVFDAVLLDIMMPDLDGIGTLHRLCAKAAACGAPRPVALAVSANVMPDDVEAYLSAGFDGHVGKPLDREDLVRKLRALVVTRKMADSGKASRA